MTSRAGGVEHRDPPHRLPVQPISPRPPDRASPWARVGAAVLWLLAAMAVAYGVWALTVAGQAALALLGLTTPGQARSIPPLFALHAATGGIALAAGAVQLRIARTILRARAPVHRVLGRMYVYAAWTTCLAGLAVTSRFTVGPSAKVAFILEAALWFAATAVAVRDARRRDLARHREWMIRSYALALFFVTFSVIQPVLDSAGVPRTPTYTFSVLASTALNLAVAEWHIRRSRPGLSRPRG